MMNLKTKRFTLKQLSLADSQLMYEICKDPDVMKYIRPVDTNILQSEKKVKEIFEYQKTNPNFGLWFAFDEKKECVGFVILLHIEFDKNNPVEIGYRIHKKYWGQGIATELAIAAKEHAVTLGLKSVCGITIEPNLNSQNVLKKIGMKYIENREFYNVNVMYFEVEL